jgi:murein DD-endopeptidase MepM/ murein hydrolase activator NlpD
VNAYLAEAGGFLSTYRQYLMITGWTPAGDIIQRVALENSINPRLLLALLEYQSGSVWGQVADPDGFQAAMGAADAYRLDFYGQLVWAAHYLEDGYYGWRTGTLTQFSLLDGTIITPSPDSNAGTVALQYLFAQLRDASTFQEVFDPGEGFLPFYQRLFPELWERAAAVEPLVPPDTHQPPLILPISSGKKWAFTSGPHPAFEKSGPLAALDFAPPTAVTGCYQSDDWVVAMADGVVVRSELGVVVQDLDRDGFEQTGWALFYLHIEERHRAPLGAELSTGDPIGHPSCEGGRATATHVHVARKYNGEWIPADGPIPFVMDGWQAHNGDASYFGSLTRGDETIESHLYATRSSWIWRDE